MKYSVTGKVFKVLQGKSYTNKKGETINQITLVIQNEKGKNLAIIFAGSLYELVKDKQIGDTIIVNYQIESREWNDKWFTDCKAY